MRALSCGTAEAAERSQHVLVLLSHLCELEKVKHFLALPGSASHTPHPAGSSDPQQIPSSQAGSEFQVHLCSGVANTCARRRILILFPAGQEQERSLLCQNQVDCRVLCSSASHRRNAALIPHQSPSWLIRNKFNVFQE